MRLTRIYRITTPDGQKISTKQLSTCIWAAMGIAVDIDDMTEEAYVPTPEVKPIEEKPLGNTAKENQRPTSTGDKQEDRNTVIVSDGKTTEVDGDKNPTNGKPIA